MAEVLSRSLSTRDICSTTELSQNISIGITKTAVPGAGEVTASATDKEDEGEDEAAEGEV
jgi:hypothetical protein